jgi:D-alanyl-D-alanine carboxypeptidase/D-alanyl-D-alanine-endopeptidase (penicillin-binding protein 4)
MIIFSDNARAEAVYYHADHFLDRWGAAPDSDGQTVHRFLAQEMEGKVPEGMTVNDGSGLSPRNVTTARFLTDLLRYAYERPELCDPLMNRLLATPCDGERTGSLYGRGFDERFARRLYCKTGTLTARGISSLAGYLHSYDGRWYAFAIMNEQTPVYEARMFQEALCRSLLEQ